MESLNIVRETLPSKAVEKLESLKDELEVLESIYDKSTVPKLTENIESLTQLISDEFVEIPKTKSPENALIFTLIFCRSFNLTSSRIEMKVDFHFPFEIDVNSEENDVSFKVRKIRINSDCAVDGSVCINDAKSAAVSETVNSFIDEMNAEMGEDYVLTETLAFILSDETLDSKLEAMFEFASDSDRSVLTDHTDPTTDEEKKVECEVSEESERCFLVALTTHHLLRGAKHKKENELVAFFKKDFLSENPTTNVWIFYGKPGVVLIYPMPAADTECAEEIAQELQRVCKNTGKAMRSVVFECESGSKKSGKLQQISMESSENLDRNSLSETIQSCVGKINDPKEVVQRILTC